MLHMISLRRLPLKEELPNTLTMKADRQTFAMNYFYSIVERNMNEALWLLFSALA